MVRPTYESVDSYIAAQPEPARSVLERVRATIRKALPGAAEGISYRIPVYNLDGAMVLYFAAFQHHYSIYPATANLVRALKKELRNRLHSKATIRFSFDGAVPTRLITRIAKLRAAEVADARAEKAARKPAAKKTAAKKAQSKSRTKPAERRAKKR